MLRRVAALSVSMMLLAGCGLLGPSDEKLLDDLPDGSSIGDGEVIPAEGWIRVRGEEWVRNEDTDHGLHRRYQMDPVPLAEYCAQLQAAHDVKLMEGSLEDGENWYESSRFPDVHREISGMIDLAPDEEEADLWRDMVDNWPQVSDLTATQEQASAYTAAVLDLRERTYIRCDMRLP